MQKRNIYIYIYERERERENNSRVLKNKEIHQYKVKMQKLFKKNTQKKKTQERERVITFLCDKICIE